VLFGPHGIPLEVQIRTEEMDQVAESGIAAHWLYKVCDDETMTPQSRANQWLKSVLEIQKNAGNSIEFLESVKVDLFPDEVYVFTPAGEIMELPRGSTPVDFAYAVHSDVGNSCIAAKIDRRLAPLSTALQSGQSVEIITAPGARPNPAWLSFVVTGKARSGIRHYLKQLKQSEAAGLGRRLLDKALAVHGARIDEIPTQRAEQLVEELGLDGFETLLADIGLGSRMAVLVARRLIEGEEPARESEQGTEDHNPLAIKGTEGVVVSFARCCNPIPGDPIVGVMSAGRGMVIHREGCRNVAEYRDKPDKWIPVQWSNDLEGEFPATIRAYTINQRGVLATLASKIADMGSNIENVSFDERDGTSITLTFALTVKNRVHLARIMRRIRAVPEVMKVMRARG
jgi:GTP pyrophosphokinase